MGFPGCIGSTDCVHIRLECCAFGSRVLHKGTEGYPTLSYEVTADPAKNYCSNTWFPGTRNDRTIVRFDVFVSDIHDGVKYQDVTYPMRMLTGVEYEEKGAWLLVDGGYHKWRCLQSPLKHTAIPREKVTGDRAKVHCVQQYGTS